MTPYFESSDVTIWNADSRDAWKMLPEQSVDAIVTSPPYFGLRDYGVDGQIGLEPTPDEYVNDLADLLTGYGERVMKSGGSLWLNLGDTYATGAGTVASVSADSTLGGGVLQGQGGFSRETADFPTKCLLMIPERVALALIGRGWILRNRVVWAKPNGMPTSVKDRLATKHEALFHLVRQPRYYYDLDAIRSPAESSRDKYMRAGKSVRENHAYGEINGSKIGDKSFRNFDGLVNPGDVWDIPTQPYPDAHFAVFPPELVRRPILATVPLGGVVLDPFFGSGTTAVMARRLGRNAWGVELNLEYCDLAAARFGQEVLDLTGGAA